MPYSKNPKNIKQCIICGNSYFRKRKLQECCSKKCSTKLVHKRVQLKYDEAKKLRKEHRICNICGEKKHEKLFHKQIDSRNNTKIHLNFCKPCWLDRRTHNRKKDKISGKYDADMDRGFYGWTDRLIDLKIFPPKTQRNNEKSNIWEKCFEKSSFAHPTRYLPMKKSKSTKESRLKKLSYQIENIYSKKRKFTKHQLIALVYENFICRKESLLLKQSEYNVWEKHLTYMATTALSGIKRYYKNMTEYEA